MGYKQTEWRKKGKKGTIKEGGLGKARQGNGRQIKTKKDEKTKGGIGNGRKWKGKAMEGEMKVNCISDLLYVFSHCTFCKMRDDVEYAMQLTQR